MEYFGVAVRHDQADQSSVCGFNRTDDVTPHMTAVVALDGATSAFYPFVARARISLETVIVAVFTDGEENASQHYSWQDVTQHICHQSETYNPVGLQRLLRPDSALCSFLRLWIRAMMHRFAPLPK